MPEITSCPDCQRNLKVPDDLVGKKVRCPGCSIMFFAQVGVGSREEPRTARTAPRSDSFSDRRGGGGYRDDRDDYDRDSRRDEEYDDRDRRDEEDDDRDRPRGKKRDPVKAWGLVRVGMSLNLYATFLELFIFAMYFILFGAVMLAGVSALSALQGGDLWGAFGRAGALYTVLLVASIFLLVCWVVVLGLTGTGVGLCLFAPQGKNGKTTWILCLIAFSSYAAFILAYFVYILCAIVVPPLALVVAIFMLLLYVSYFICWMLFLRLLCLDLRDPDVAHRAMVYMITAIVFPFAAFLVGLLSLLHPILVLIAAFLITLAGLAMLFWYVSLIAAVRDVVDRKLERL
jgi:hypothetical protein